MKLCVKKTSCFLVIIYLLFFFITVYSDENGKWLLLFAICMCFLFMKWHWHSQPMLIILFFVSTYFIYMIPYYFFGISYCDFKNLQTLEYTNGTLRIVSMFVLLLFLNIKYKKETDHEFRFYLEDKHNRLAYLLCTIIMIVILLYAFLSDNIIDHIYGKDTAHSTVFTYYFLFAIIAYCNVNDRLEKNILLGINIVYSIAILLLGLRLVFLIDFMLIFIFHFEGRFKTKWVMLASIIGFLGMSAIAWLRMGITKFDFLTLLGMYRGRMMTNQGGVFLTSTVHYGIVQNGFMTLEDRMASLTAFIANFFLPSSAQFEIGILNQYIRGTYSVGGGGFGAMYAYVWLGYVGVIFLALFISHYINQVYDIHKNSYYGLFLIITTFQWFPYSLPIVFKMGLYLFLFYWAFNLIKSKSYNINKQSIAIYKNNIFRRKLWD